ncbi:hypothetical protein D1872_62490 [compost metagenome]
MIKRPKLLFDIGITADLSLNFPAPRFGNTTLWQQIYIIYLKLMCPRYSVQHVFNQSFIFLLMKRCFNLLYDDYLFLTIDFSGKYSDRQGQLRHILLDGPFNIDSMMIFTMNDDDFLLSADDIDMIVCNKTKVSCTEKTVFLCIGKYRLKSAVRFFLPV